LPGIKGAHRFLTEDLPVAYLMNRKKMPFAVISTISIQFIYRLSDRQLRLQLMPYWLVAIQILQPNHLLLVSIGYSASSTVILSIYLAARELWISR
jgi:hypothetical protein